MKYWIPGIVILMMLSTAYAENYRLVQSPTLKLEVFIDDVKNSAPENWCASSIPLRIVSAQSTDAAILVDFLPRVGNLLQKQCIKVTQLPWVLTNKQGKKIASGSTNKNWQPIFQSTQATGPSDNLIPSAVTVTSPLATKDIIASFALPQGCQFRTYWHSNANDSTLFIPNDNALRCDDNQQLNGHGAITIQQKGITQTYNVVFYQGYPLLNIDTGDRQLAVVSANAQRLILGNSGSFMVLHFNPQVHAWAFQGEVVIEMSREQAADQVEVGKKVTQAQVFWRPLMTQSGMPLLFRLVEKLAVDRVDPASGSYQSVNGFNH